jgi:hypothetical protein
MEKAVAANTSNEQRRTPPQREVLQVWGRVESGISPFGDGGIRIVPP